MQNLSVCVPWVELPASPKWAEIIKAQGERLLFPKDATVVGNGDVVKNAYYVEEGVAKYILNGYSGSARVAGILPPGRAFGLGPIFHQDPIVLTVTTIEDSIIYCLPQEKALQAIQEDVFLAIDVIKNISHKLRSVMTALCLVSTCSAEERLTYYFFTLIFCDGIEKAKVNTWEELPINLSHEQIGEIIGTNRVTVCRLFSKFKGENKLKQVEHSIYVNTSWLRPNGRKLYTPKIL